ncbi:hypothetical protein HH212_01120 [Massilia forsythiae]|uniref:Uncharacterized protein n=1 Tax=Massilia forsythiae TaxID=2728020 RepID=A0A7Z2ZR49_9BURK|nr:hypothetical protein [Massilia forsythiae]QJD98808.1 hypothetical protein HH212_01120 [Massilia forsythiae]
MPFYPIPNGLWSTLSGAIPASGNYDYLQSANGGYIGQGRTYAHTTADSILAAKGVGLSVDVKGNQKWSGGFLLPSAAGK